MKCNNCKQYKLHSMSFYGMVIFFWSWIVAFVGLFIFPLLIVVPVIWAIAIITIGSDMILKYAGRERIFVCTNCQNKIKK